MSVPAQNSHNSHTIISEKSGIMAFGSLLLLLTLTFSSCSLFHQAKEYNQFIHSRFFIRDIKVLSVSGIDVSQMKQYSDLNFGQLLSLGIQLVKGNLPTVMEITVEGHNNSSSKAAISGMDWLLVMQSDTLAKGVINNPIIIQPEKSTNFPVKVNFNLSRLIKSGSLEQIMDAALGNNSKQKLEELGIVFKFKPWYSTGNKIKKSPVYFSVHPDLNQLN